jgi:hypothetical protein
LRPSIRVYAVPASPPPAPEGTPTQPGTFVVARSVRRFWAGPVLQRGGHDHGGAGGVPLDLDEAAAGAKSMAKNFGPWAQRSILGLGVYYAADGCHHSAHTLRAFPQAHADATALRDQMCERPPQYALDAIWPGTVEPLNTIAVQHLAEAQIRELRTEVGLAAASFVGCLAMGASLLCDDQMVGYILPKAVNYADTCMALAVPAMCAYAGGVAAVAISEWRANGQRAWRLAEHAKQWTRAEGRSTKMAVDSVVRDILAQRQDVSVRAIAASVAMGFGIALTWAFGVVGLAILLPGALSLPTIMAQRHRPKLEAADVPQTLSYGTLTMLGSSLLHLHHQSLGLELIRERLCAMQPGAWQRFMGAITPASQRHVELAHAMQALRAVSQRAHLDALPAALRAPGAAASCSDAVLDRLGGDVSTHEPAEVATAWTQQAADDGLYADLAWAILNEPIWAAHLPAAANGTVVLSPDHIVNLMQVGNHADRAMHLRTLAKLVVDLYVTHGRAALNAEKNKVADLWMEVVGVTP